MISLDFELHWGVRHARPPHDPALAGARRAVPALLELFARHRIGATWATVGLLFAGTRGEQERWRPSLTPSYADPSLDPYRQEVGADEEEDPVHFGRSLIGRILDTPGQEVGSHTYSHYFCLEPGQDEAAFRADLQSARLAAGELGVRLESLVFPSNQHNPAYDRAVGEAGFSCIRGNRPFRIYRGRGVRAATLDVRATRLLDSYLPVTGPGAISWQEVPRPDGLCDIPASFVLRAHAPGRAALDRLQRRRIGRALERAALRGEILHLWWHPHNFGVHTQRNLEELERLLDAFDRLRARHGMLSLSMAGAAALARGGDTS